MKAKLDSLLGTLWAIWKRFRSKLPVWPRRWKVIRNLTVAIVLLAAAPAIMDWPVFSQEATFRRLEAQALLSPSELIMRVGNTYVMEGEDWITVGMTYHHDNWWKPFQNIVPEIYYVVPKREVSVLLLPELEDDKIVAVASGLPEEAKQGVLTLDIGERVVNAVRDEHDLMVFRIGNHSLSWLDLRGKLPDNSYTLELLNDNGELLQRMEGKFPDYLTFLNGQMIHR